MPTPRVIPRFAEGRGWLSSTKACAAMVAPANRLEAVLKRWARYVLQPDAQAQGRVHILQDDSAYSDAASRRWARARNPLVRW